MVEVSMDSKWQPAAHNINHPELREGEVFLTNTSDRLMMGIGRKGKRIGVVAYDVNRKPVEGMYPVFCEYDPMIDSTKPLQFNRTDFVKEIQNG